MGVKKHQYNLKRIFGEKKKKFLFCVVYTGNTYDEMESENGVYWLIKIKNCFIKFLLFLTQSPFKGKVINKLLRK